MKDINEIMEMITIFAGRDDWDSALAQCDRLEIALSLNAISKALR